MRLPCYLYVFVIRVCRWKTLKQYARAFSQVSIAGASSQSLNVYAFSKIGFRTGGLKRCIIYFWRICACKVCNYALAPGPYIQPCAMCYPAGSTCLGSRQSVTYSMLGIMVIKHSCKKRAIFKYQVCTKASGGCTSRVPVAAFQAIDSVHVLTIAVQLLKNYVDCQRCLHHVDIVRIAMHGRKGDIPTATTTTRSIPGQPVSRKLNHCIAPKENQLLSALLFPSISITPARRTERENMVYTVRRLCRHMQGPGEPPQIVFRLLSSTWSPLWALGTNKHSRSTPAVNANWSVIRVSRAYGKSSSILKYHRVLRHNCCCAVCLVCITGCQISLRSLSLRTPIFKPKSTPANLPPPSTPTQSTL